MRKRLFKTTSIFASITTVSRMLGYFRDMTIARLFGTDAAIDVFYTVIKVLAAFRSFIENPLQLFIPTLAEYKKTQSQEKIKNLIATTMGTLGVGVIAIVMLTMFTIPYWMKGIAPGLDTYRFELARASLKISLPYLIFMFISGLSVQVMNTYGQIWGVATAPMWGNIIIIGVALWFAPYFSNPTVILMWGVVLGGLLQVIFVLFFLKHLNLLAWPRIDFRNADITRLTKLMLPAVLGASSSQLSLMINTHLASYLTVGTMSWVYYADRLVYFPLSIIGISISLALLPILSQQYIDKTDPEAFDRTLGWGVRFNILVALPVAVMMGLLAGPLITTLFAYGRFSVNDVMQTRNAVLAYSVGMPAFMLIRTLVIAFHAQRDTYTPIKIVFWTSLINIILGFFLVPHLKHVGIVIASSFSGWLQVISLVLLLKRPFDIFKSPLGWTRWIFSLLTSAIALVIFFAFASPELSYWLDSNSIKRVCMLLALFMGAGLIMLINFFCYVGFDYRKITTHVI